MQEEVNEKVIALSIKTGKLTAEVLQKSMKFFLSQAKKKISALRGLLLSVCLSTSKGRTRRNTAKVLSTALPVGGQPRT